MNEAANQAQSSRRQQMALDGLSTEGARADLADFDLWTTRDAIDVFVHDQQAVTEAVRLAAPAIEAVVDGVAARMLGGGRLIYIGAGTGGRMASVDAAEIGPTYGLYDRVVAVLAGGIDALSGGRESTEDDADAGAADLLGLEPTPGDVVFGLSASGRTPYVLGGVRAGAGAGALTVGFACTLGSPLAGACDLAIEVPTGPEIIAGSTRLKAGSAQKVVINAISTLVMVRLGRTYGNLMVDVVADNAKLQRRAVRAVVQATGVDEARAASALSGAGGRAKVAVVALLAGVAAARAEELLALAAGHVRKAVSLADTLG